MGTYVIQKKNELKHPPILDIYFTGKVQCPEFGLFLSGLYEHAHFLNSKNWQHCVHYLSQTKSKAANIIRFHSYEASLIRFDLSILGILSQKSFEQGVNFSMVGSAILGLLL